MPRVFPCTRWATGLALIALLGLAVRLVYILGFRYPMVAGGDAFYYHAGANLLVEGHGFIQPTDYFQEHWTVQPESTCVQQPGRHEQEGVVMT